MGDFRMTIEAVGGHGCDRNAKAGDQVRGCGGETCPDCIFARFVSELQRAGMRPWKATFHHWPADMAAHDFPLATSERPPSLDERCARCNVTRQEASATHRCTSCHALWRLNPADPAHYPAPHPFSKETWSLVSSKCGPCCDNVEMGAQIVELSATRDYPRICRAYDPAREVVDDYTERDVKYPSGAFRRATGKRVKGSF
jgi:hypothetical protein